MNKPIITVYTAHHNYLEYLQTAVDSVNAQSFKGFEHIIINDGSEGDIIRFSTATQIKNNSKQGLVNCANKAALMAKGDYIIRLDADDWFTENALLHLLSHAYRTDADIVYPEYFETSREGGLRHVVHRSYSKDDPPLGACCLIKKSFLRSIDYYDSSFVCQDGLYLYLRAISSKAKVEYLKHPCFVYYRHPTSLSHQKKLISESKKKILEKWG